MAQPVVAEPSPVKLPQPETVTRRAEPVNNRQPAPVDDDVIAEAREGCKWAQSKINLGWDMPPGYHHALTLLAALDARQPAPVDDEIAEIKTFCTDYAEQVAKKGASQFHPSVTEINHYCLTVLRALDAKDARIAELEAELKGFEPIDCVPIIAERDRLRAALERIKAGPSVALSNIASEALNHE